MKVKLCGFCDSESVSYIANLKKLPDFIGFVFHHSSKRFITPTNSAIISSSLPKEVMKVAVVVNPSLDFLREIKSNLSPDLFQFHGSESPEFLQSLKSEFKDIKFIKAFCLNSKEDLQKTSQYDVADFFLFDSGPKSNSAQIEFGGTGTSFDWSLLSDFKCDKDWFLAGGLTPQNVGAAIKTTKTKIVDVSSGIEEKNQTGSAPKKSQKLIAEFIANATS